ncbi:MAG: hypothetical protein U0793_14705 [Gemmataceae bacterium]
MPRPLLTLACSLLLFTADLYASEPLRSGPPVGAPNNRRGFTPKWITGPCAGKHLCPV